MLQCTHHSRHKLACIRLNNSQHTCDSICLLLTHWSESGQAHRHQHLNMPATSTATGIQQPAFEPTCAFRSKLTCSSSRSFPARNFACRQAQPAVSTQQGSEGLRRRTQDAPLTQAMQKKLQMHDNLQVLLPAHHGPLLISVHDTVDPHVSVIQRLMLLFNQAARVALF